MTRSTVCWGIAVTALLAVGEGRLSAQFPAGGPYSQADIQVGARVFASHASSATARRETSSQASTSGAAASIARRTTAS